MRKIYIILMHTHTIPSRLIKAVTKYEYSHVGISLSEDCSTIYSFGRKKVHSILNAGFSIERKDGDFFKTFNRTDCKIFEVEVKEEQYEKVRRMLEYMIQNRKGYKYDYFCIIPRFLGIPVTLKNRYVCSYFVALILARAKIHRFNKKVCMVKPQDFSKIRSFHEIYKGSYVLYK